MELLMKKLSLVIIAIGLFCSLGTFAQTKVEATQAVNQVLDGLHEAASQADLAEYLGSFTDTGIFMGTDDWERWSRPETLDKYVAERFAGGTGWTYKSVERNINFSTEQNIAWFDEITVSEKWGRFRGTGVLINDNGNWKRSRRSILKLLLSAQKIIGKYILA